MRTFILKALVLSSVLTVSCGKDGSKALTTGTTSVEEQHKQLDQEAANGWTAGLKFQVYSSCVDAAKDTATHSDGFISVYCNCMIDAIAATYTVDYFDSSGVTAVAELIKNGTRTSCQERAASVYPNDTREK